MGKQITLHEMIKECEDEQKSKAEKIPANDAGKRSEKKVLREEL